MKELQYLHLQQPFWFLSMQCLLKKKKKALISVWSPWMHCIIPVIVPIAVIIQQNIELFSKKHSTQAAQVLARDLWQTGWQKEWYLLSFSCFYRCRSEDATRSLFESQAAYERGRKRNDALLLDRKHSVDCKHWSMAFRYLKGNHTFSSVTVLRAWNKAGQGRPAGCEE